MRTEVMPLRYKLTEGRHDPKEAVLPIIKEKFPWHWDPMKTDHDDAKGFVGNWNDTFDWEALSKWCIKKLMTGELLINIGITIIIQGIYGTDLIMLHIVLFVNKH